MGYEFSLAQLSVLHCAPPDMVRLAGKCGYEYASLRPVYMGLPGEPNYELAKQPVMMRETKQAMADTGVRIHDVELFRILKDKDVRDYEGALAAGAELGAKSALSSIWTDDLAYAAEQFGVLAELAGRYGLNVDLEYVTWAGVKNLEQALNILRVQSADNIGVLVDTLHTSRSRVTLDELAAIPDRYIHFLHLCDGPGEPPAMDDKDALIHTAREARLYIGEGGIDIAGMMNRLPVRVCSIELPNDARVAEYGYEEHARRCLISAKEYIARNEITGRAVGH